ncbi:MAG: hypothetical protein OEM67_13160, partial [Thermoleophilia bacterium]|nr:hypothetical protein [Thermoleophilia bacterium]
MPAALRSGLVGLALLASPLSAQVDQAGPTIQGFLFGDGVFTVADGSAPDGFKMGQIVGHANAALSERVLF